MFKNYTFYESVNKDKEWTIILINRIQSLIYPEYEEKIIKYI